MKHADHLPDQSRPQLQRGSVGPPPLCSLFSIIVTSEHGDLLFLCLGFGGYVSKHIHEGSDVAVKRLCTVRWKPTGPTTLADSADVQHDFFASLSLITVLYRISTVH